MKKTISMAMIACLLLSLLALPVAIADDADGTLRVVSTIFPPYDFVRQIAGDAVGDTVELSMLLPPGSESHSFEPTPQDIIRIQNADVFLYIGGEADAWVDRILASMDTSGMTILPLTGMVDTVEEEIVEGMEHDHDHEEEAFDPANVHDRPLADWAGAWQSLAPYVQDGSLDAYIQAQADEADTTLDAQRDTTAGRWRTDDFDTFAIDGDTVTIGDHTAPYAYAGYAILENDSGASVWYQYTLDGDAEGMPRYLIFNDHGTGGDAHDDHDDHDHGLAHTHLRYGDDGFDALLTVEGWSPFFIDASATADDMLDTLTGHSHTHAHEHELDEHVWTSPKNAMAIVAALTDTLSALDPAGAADYRINADAYLQKLADLDAAFAEAVAAGSRDTLLFGDRFPFRYLADAYGLSYWAAFPGCANETEASASTIAFLIDKAREEDFPVVFTIEFSNGKIADVISESSNAQKLEMHSCHNVSKADFDAGVGYVDLMWRNVDAIKEALQ